VGGIFTDYKSTIPWAKRRHELVAVAHNWGRWFKGPDLLRALTKKFNIEIYGNRFYNKNYHLNRAEVLKLLGDTKVLISPSWLDSFPQVIIEAWQLGANVVQYKNIGTAYLNKPELNADHTVASYSQAIAKARARYIGHKTLPTAEDLYRQFKDIISKLAKERKILS